MLVATGLLLLSGVGMDEEEQGPSLVPDALAVSSTAEEMRELSVILALDALDEALSLNIDVRRLVAAEFARTMALRARSGQDVEDTRLILELAYGTSSHGAGADSPEPSPGVRRALLLVRARAHEEAAGALERAGVAGALVAYGRLMTNDFSASAPGVFGDAIAAHVEEPPHHSSQSERAKLLARACRFQAALEALGGLRGPRGKYSLTRGISLRERGRWREAAEEFMKLKDSTSTARQAAGFILAGMTLLEHGRYSSGMRTLERGTELVERIRGSAAAAMSYGLAWLYLHDYGSGKAAKIHIEALGGSPWLASRAAPRLSAWSDELVSLRRKSPERKIPPKTKFTEAMGYSREDSEVSYALRRIGFDSPPAGLSGGMVASRPGRGGVLRLVGGRVFFDAPFVETVTTIGCSVSVSSEGVLEILAETDAGEEHLFLVPGLPPGEWVDLDVPLGAFEGPGRPFGKRFRRIGFAHPGGALVDDVMIFHGPQFTR